MKFLSGFLTALLILVVAVSAAVLSGSFNTAASVPAGAFEKRVATLALDRSVARRAPRASNPLKPSPDVLKDGLAHYKEMCVICHGAPGVDAGEVGEGLNPPAPDLTLAKVQKRSDGELYWIVQNGIRMTGMPAFGVTHKEDQLWRIVTFVRHLPELKPEEQKVLKSAEAEEHGHGEAEEHHHEGEASEQHHDH
jgi:mono/diheme cytochrome c family protein